MIEFHGVTKKYGKKKVLDDVNIQLKKSEITYLVGRNGAGKSTLLKALMNLVHCDNGVILVDGTETKKRANFAYITELQTFSKSFTIGDACIYMKDFYDNWDEEKAKNYLSFFQLNEKQKLHALSKGESMKVNLAIGLSLQSEYLILDEPFSGIDAISKEELFTILLEELDGQRGVLITTHDMEEVKYWVDRVLILKEGKIVGDAYLENLQEEGKSILNLWKEVEGK